MIFVDIESLIPETHLLRKIERMVSFDFIYDLLAPYYPCLLYTSVSAEFVEEQAASIFADVPADAYYAKAVEWAVKKGITNGKANGLFGSNDPCTRGQIVTFLWRAAGSPASKGTAKVSADVLPGS